MKPFFIVTNLTLIGVCLLHIWMERQSLRSLETALEFQKAFKNSGNNMKVAVEIYEKQNSSTVVGKELLA